VDALKEYCTLWCTINEPNGYALNGYVGGSGLAPWKKPQTGMQVQANLVADMPPPIAPSI
jgi:hypothetical protein